MKVNKKIKETKFQSTVWPFQIDNLQNWAFYNSVFTKEECEKIISIGNKKGLYRGTTIQTTKNVRDSNICWLLPSDDLDWAFRRITDIVLELNSKFFNFDLYGFIEGFQFTHYKEPDGKYKKHIDRGLNIQIRKLSLSIQLSDPNSYKGGDLILHYEDIPTILPKEQGKLLMFPSYTVHEVTPVTKNERYSLVAWITGPQFR